MQIEVHIRRYLQVGVGVCGGCVGGGRVGVCVCNFVNVCELQTVFIHNLAK